MSEETKIARVYAEALFEAAQEEGRLEQVRRDLDDFAAALEETPQLQAFLEDEEISAPEKQRLLMELTEGADPLVQNFLRLLVDKDRESVFGEARQIFADLVEAAAGVVKVELTTAVPLPDEVEESIRKTIEKGLGREVELNLVVDEDILGGVRLRIGDRIADASLRHRLEQLRALLVKPSASREVSVEASS
ncbi:MAG: F0F1 ATP synthase subunit delta [Thermoleophilia bacterium]